MYLCFCCFYFDDAAFDRCRGVLHTSQFISGQTSLAAAAALTFFCSFSCVKTRKGEEQGFCLFFPVSRQEKNRGFAPLPPPSFLPLMEEKKAKEDQGVRDAGQTSLPGRGRQGRRPSFPSTRPNFAGGRSRLDFLLLLFLCQDKKRRRTGALPLFPVSRQEKNRGFAPLPHLLFLP